MCSFPLGNLLPAIVGFNCFNALSSTWQCATDRVLRNHVLTKIEPELRNQSKHQVSLHQCALRENCLGSRSSWGAEESRRAEKLLERCRQRGEAGPGGRCRQGWGQSRDPLLQRATWRIAFVSLLRIRWMACRSCLRLLGRRSCLMPGRHRRALELRRKVPVPRKKALEHHRKLPEHRRMRKELRSHRWPPSWSRNLRCHLLHQARSRWGGPIGRGALRKEELNFKVNLGQ